MQLDEYQEAAATTTDPRVLVSAVPGSGKTRTLAARYLHMVEEMHIHPSYIVLLTFTRYGANEMKDRIGKDRCRDSFIGTFHAFALCLLRMYGHHLGWEQDWLTILDAAETKLDDREVLRDLQFIDRKGRWSGCKKGEWSAFRSRVANGSHDPEKATILDQRLAVVWKAIEGRLKAENVLTYDTLILEALHLLEDVGILGSLQKRYKHFLIDEAQDTDMNQWAIVDRFEPMSRFVVGDVDQAIFEWRGAAPHLFRQYAATATRFDLPNSYRFGFNVAQSANALIRHNVDRLDIAINAIADNAGTVQVMNNVDYPDMVDILRQELKAFAPCEIAVLSRKHSTLDILANMLKFAQVPFVKIGGTEAVPATAEFRTIRGYLRLNVNPNSRRSFHAIAAAEHLSKEVLVAMRERAVKERKTLLALFKEAGFNLPSDLPQIHDHLQKVDEFTDYTEAIDYLTDIMFHEAITTITELVDCLALDSAQDQLRKVDDELTLCTIHAAKGLEWPVVVVVGMNAKQFPSPRSVREGRREEERRLCYVAMTRAENKLYLIQNVPEDFGGDGPSSFLAEIGDVERGVHGPPEEDLVY